MAVVGISTSADDYEQLSSRNNAKLCQVVGEARKIVAPGATTYQLKKGESGAICLFDGVAVAYRLPAITDSTDYGMFFDFAVTTTTTSNHSVTIFAGSGDLLVGVLIGFSDVAGASDAFTADGTSHVTMVMDATTKLGIAGGRFRMTAVTASQWLVEGMAFGSGTLATPFA